MQGTRPAAPAEPSRRVLLLDADHAARDLLGQRLQLAGYGVTSLAEPSALLATAERERPDLLMIDWDTPGCAPLDLLASLRTHRRVHADGPRVLLFSASAAEPQVIAGFEAGADDFVVKPYSMAELLARVRALLRSIRSPEESGQVLRFRELVVSGLDLRLTINEQPVALRGTEYRLLEFLVRNPERAFSRSQLLDRVWGRDTRAEERAIDVTIQRVRKALARHQCAHYIQTIRGFGYRISAAATALSTAQPEATP